MAARLRGAICAGAWDRVGGLVTTDAASTEDVASLRLALHWAAMSGAPARVVVKLVDAHPQGANATDIDGATALMIACDCGHAEAATALLRCDPPADAEPADARGWTALMRAARTGSAAIAEAIVESWRSTRSAEELAALVSTGSADGRSAADWAEVYHHHDLAAQLRTLAPGVASPRAAAKAATEAARATDPDAPSDSHVGMGVGADGGALPRITERIPPASQRAPGAASGGIAEGFAEVMMRAVQAKAGEEGLAPVAEWLGQLLAHVTSVQATGKPAKDAKGAVSATLMVELGERFDSLESRADGLRDEGAVLAARVDESTTVLQEVWQAAVTELWSEIRSTRGWAESVLAEQAAKAAEQARATAKVEDHGRRLHNALDRAGIEVELTREELDQIATEQDAAAKAIQLRYKRHVAQQTAAEQIRAAGNIQRAWRRNKREALSKVAGEMPAWSVTDVSCWLREIVGLGQYTSSFEGERVDGSVLMLLGKLELVRK